MNDKLFVFSVNAVAGSGLPYQAGARHAQLVFALGASLELAQARALAAVKRAGWEFAQVLDAAPATADADDIEDEALRSAAQGAMADGCAIVTYANPIPTDA